MNDDLECLECDHPVSRHTPRCQERDLARYNHETGEYLEIPPWCDCERFRS